MVDAVVRRILLTVFALMVLLPSFAFARSEYLCRLDGQVRASCCCHPTVQKHDAPRPASVQSACCCTVFEARPPRLQPATTESATDLRSHVPAFVAPVRIAAPPTIVSVLAPEPRSMAPPDRGQSLVVRHCAFLL